ncbi:WD40/YVTN/BNR-like repeat-containing protein [Aquimarina algicola]|uniref:Glycosyl hydrolase n=1 Tax=Aquimarina algicola TaxID=2589995 RepID=A0A504JJV5_9FLAO|nr:sialidase family protein [Aquimarina algicola]TPN88635.1 glycosyl hydrolase [Aquimarina algicola]
MKTKQTRIFLLILFNLVLISVSAQRSKSKTKQVASSIVSDSTFTGLKLRNIGPAFMSGRIADIVIHPQNENIRYVGVGSGGVWKTVNAGTTWTPIFDDQTSYSIGCIAMDPGNHNTIWVGTGENVGGRHVGYGDGIYKSTDGGANWTNMGLKTSEHISKIIIHPENSNVIWVAVQGPLWKKGGERGLYKSIDGGKTWKKTLGDAEWIGVTDIVIDPRNPDQLYAATWQRHRTVAAYIGGGPGSGIHRSVDGGETWEELKNGLPTSWMGKIGLAISPQKPDILYAAIELDRRTGAVYRSSDRGTTWEKRSDAVSGATGPHYYQELYASPHHFERLYLVDVRMQISEDGGKTFTRMKEEHKHSDNHAIAFKKSDPNYLLVGTDGGLYETFDLTKNWRFIDNLPITQYYKLAVDDAAPFYNIYGGTQDNSTQGGPSRTDNVHGIQNSDWRVVLNWDGHQPATEPGNPDIMYAERQEGNLSRVDLSTGEVIDIQPQPGADENFERFNWDAPILVSAHDPKRIYFASQRLWRSDNRGDQWTAISGDLTKNQERITLPIMGKKQSWDAPWDFLAMSNYNTITSIAESPKQENILYVGTDDGAIQVTENGGDNWKKIEAGSLPGVPSTAFVNDIKADLFDANTVYVALDNHKYGDFNPYLFKSTDKGQTWTSIVGNLPQRTLIWRIVQDHVQSNLLFAATEFGIYFTINGGKKWVKLQGGAPTISFRDIAIQRRENDLVGASFGRGFFVFDDYTPLRNISEAKLQEEAILFPTRDAWWYIPRSHLSFDDQKGSQGASHYVAPNPDFGAVFTYYLKDGLKTAKETRQKREKANKAKDIAFSGWESVDAEHTATTPKIIITITDSNGKAIRRIKGDVKKGFHRIAWDLRYPSPYPITLQKQNDSDYTPKGFMAPPGTYTATLSKVVEGKVTVLSEPITFVVKQMRKGALPGVSVEESTAFLRTYENAIRDVSAIDLNIKKGIKTIAAMKRALQNANSVPGDLDTRLHALSKKMQGINKEFNGSPSKQQVGEKNKPTLQYRMFAIQKGVERSTYGPTDTHRKTMQIITASIDTFKTKINNIQNEIKGLTKELNAVGAPFIEE